MIREILIRRLTFKSLLKLFFIGFGSWMIPICWIGGIIGFLGGSVMMSGNAYIYGWHALLSGFLGGPFFVFFLSVIAACFCYSGLWIYPLFRPLLLSYIETKKGIADEQSASASGQSLDSGPSIVEASINTCGLSCFRRRTLFAD